MTILILSSAFYPALGGIEISIANLASAYQAAGHDVTIFTSRPVQSVAHRLSYPVISYKPATIRLMNRSPKLGRRYIELQLSNLLALNADVWHVFQLYPFGWATADFIRRHDIPAIVSAQGVDIQVQPDVGYGYRLNPKLAPLVRHAAHSYPYVTALTESVADDLRTIAVPETRIRVIGNGVDIERFQQPASKAELRAKLELPTRGPILLAVGRNHVKKNYAILPDIVSRLRADYPHIHCVIVGNETPALHPIINAHGLGDSFTLIDHVGGDDDDGLFAAPPRGLIEYYCAADCFAFPSLTETFGIVLIEAMAAGLPVVTTNVPGCRDVVDNGKTGLLVAPTVDAMVDGLHRVLADDGFRNTLIANGRHHATQLNWSSIAASYLELYRALQPTL